MKVVHLAASDDLSTGSQYALFELVLYEMKQGITPIVVLPGSGELRTALDAIGVETWIIAYKHRLVNSGDMPLKSHLVSYTKSIFNCIADFKLSKVLRKLRPDLLHVNSSAIDIGIIPAKKMNIPVVWHLREFNDSDNGRIEIRGRKGKKLIESVTCCIAVSDALAKRIRLQFPTASVSTVYDCVPYPAVERTKPIFSEKEIKIAIISNISAGKGQLDVAEAASMMERRLVSNVFLSFYGSVFDNAYFKKMESVLSQSQMSFKFCGYAHDVYNILHNSDISIISSRSESFGRVTVESMYSECLVIGANNTGTSELLSDGRGLLYETGNPVHLKEQLEYALAHRAEARLIAQKGHEYSLFYSDANARNSDILSIFQSTQKED